MPSIPKAAPSWLDWTHDRRACRRICWRHCRAVKWGDSPLGRGQWRAGFSIAPSSTPCMTWYRPSNHSSPSTNGTALPGLMAYVAHRGNTPGRQACWSYRRRQAQRHRLDGERLRGGVSECARGARLAGCRRLWRLRRLLLLLLRRLLPLRRRRAHRQPVSWGATASSQFIDWAGQRHGRGVFVLVRTSNPSAADVQDVQVDDGRPLYEHIGAHGGKLGGKQPRAERLFVRGRRGGGNVAGAGGSACAPSCRIPLFLVPGYGAQGATAADVARCFDAGGHGALVNASRSIIFAWSYQTLTRGATPNPITGRRHAKLPCVWGTTFVNAQREFSGA